MKIVTDSAADMPVQEVDSLGVTVAPLFIHFPEGEMKSSDLSADEFYRRLEAMQPHIPTTAQPSEKVFSDLYQKISEDNEDILSIHISSGLSGTINSAQLAANQMSSRKVQVVDSMTLSGGERFPGVLAAVDGIRKGHNVETILRKLEEIRRSTEVIYSLDTLKYLARGGRIGRVQSLAGSLLNIKPIIRVAHEDGKYSTVGRARTVRRAIEEMVNHLLNIYKAEQNLWVTVLHGNFREPAEEMVEMLRPAESGKNRGSCVSPVLGVHTGPGIVGAAVVPLGLME